MIGLSAPWHGVLILLTVCTSLLWRPFESDAGVITCFFQEPTIVGTRANDVLGGTPSRDVIVGLGGDDVIRGLGGNDDLCGDAGSDRILGAYGRDVLSGGQAPTR